jgi:hypothetical protein
VIDGMRALVEQARPVMTIALDGTFEDARALVRDLAASGYRFTRVDDGADVTDFDRGAPHRDGVWGSLLAIPRDPSATRQMN